jgi:hypothetical protein
MLGSARRDTFPEISLRHTDEAVSDLPTLDTCCSPKANRASEAMTVVEMMDRAGFAIHRGTASDGLHEVIAG